MSKRFLAMLLLAGSLIHAGGTSLAITWNNPLGGDFGVATNWNPAMVPGGADLAEFDLLGPYTVSFIALQNTAQLDVLGANVTFDMGGIFYTVEGSVTLDDSAASFGIPGNRGLEVLGGTLEVNPMGHVGDFLRVGGLALGKAELIVGAGGTVTSGAQLLVAGSDNIDGNTVTVTNGGSLSAQEASGTAALLGGTTGQSAAFGSATVTGSGSQFNTSSTLVVGGAGTGVLSIVNSATLNTMSSGAPTGGVTGIIGLDAGSMGTVNVLSSGVWTDSAGIDVGRGGSGVLNIASAGTVNSPTSTVGRLPGSTGGVTIDGSNSLWLLTGDLTIGGTTTSAGGVGTVDVSNGGTLEAALSTIQVRSGSQLSGDGFVTASQVDVDDGATLSGPLTITGNVNNSGNFTPGFVTGVTTINGDFTQGPTGVLEIEVEGLIPGTQHDQLQISGNASLAGRLDVPVTGGPGFPMVNDEIIFLETGGPGGVLGTFDSLSSPNLAAEAPGLALRVLYSPIDVRLRFVLPEQNVFLPSPIGIGNWSDPTLWTGGTPDSASDVQLENLSGLPQRVDVGLPGDRNAFVHELNVTGPAGSMTLAVGGDANFSATNSVVVGDNGVVDIAAGGTVTTHCLHVDAGGLLTGNGTVNGDILLGSAVGGTSATLSPGNSTGTLINNGNLVILSNAVMDIEVVTDNDTGADYDVVQVTGEISYGGTLAVDASTYAGNLPTLTPGNIPTLDVITSGSRTGATIFDQVLTSGISGVYFAPTYSFDGTVLSLLTVGDMNANGYLDDLDPSAFALALTEPLVYHGMFGVFGFQSGNFDGDFDFDFDDIDGFLALFPSLTAADIFGLTDDLPALQTALTDAMSAHAVDLLECGALPEPATAWLFLIGGSLLGTRRIGRRGGPGRAIGMRE